MRWPPRDVTPLRSDIFTALSPFSQPQELFHAKEEGPIQIFARLDRASNDDTLIRKVYEGIIGKHTLRDTFVLVLVVLVVVVVVVTSVMQYHAVGMKNRFHHFSITISSWYLK